MSQIEQSETPVLEFISENHSEPKVRSLPKKSAILQQKIITLISEAYADLGITTNLKNLIQNSDSEKRELGRDILHKIGLQKQFFITSICEALDPESLFGKIKQKAQIELSISQGQPKKIFWPRVENNFIPKEPHCLDVLVLDKNELHLTFIEAIVTAYFLLKVAHSDIKDEFEFETVTIHCAAEKYFEVIPVVIFSKKSKKISVQF